MFIKDWVEMKIWHAKGRQFGQRDISYSYLQLSFILNFNLAKVFGHLHDMSTDFYIL
jgi:hypothetical protein